MARTDFNYRPEIEKIKNEIDEETKDIETEKTSSKSSATTSAIKSTDETKVITQKDDTNKTATADNPFREAYRAKIKQQALEKFLPGGGDPMKMTCS
jgi:hypothetical protein